MRYWFCFLCFIVILIIHIKHLFTLFLSFYIQSTLNCMTSCQGATPSRPPWTRGARTQLEFTARDYEFTSPMERSTSTVRGTIATQVAQLFLHHAFLQKYVSANNFFCLEYICLLYLIIMIRLLNLLSNIFCRVATFSADLLLLMKTFHLLTTSIKGCYIQQWITQVVRNV